MKPAFFDAFMDELEKLGAGLPKLWTSGRRMSLFGKPPARSNVPGQPSLKR